MDADLTPEEVWPAFVDSLGVEVRPGVIEIDDAEGIVELHAAPEELVELAFLEFDVFGDPDLDIVPRSKFPRRLGLALAMDDIERILRERADDETYVVLYDGSFARSTRAALPPYPSEREPTDPDRQGLHAEHDWSEV